MDANLTGFSTEKLAELLAAKLKNPNRTELHNQVIEAIQNELESRKEKVK